MFKAYARKLAEEGFKVFPVWGVKDGVCQCGRVCKTPGKHPIPINWRYLSTLSSSLDEWEIQHPDANIGINTEDLIVIDVDNPLAPLARLLENFPETRTASSGRTGGLHFYFKPSRNHKLSVHSVNGVDIRSKGGQIVAPPSRHSSGKLYTWVNTYDIAILSDSQISLLEESVRKTREESRYVVQSGGKISEGMRHNWLRSEIMRLSLRGLSREEIQAVTDQVLLDKIEGSVSSQELANLISGAMQKRESFVLRDHTEVGIAEKFADFYKEELVYLTSGQWYRLDGGVWKEERYPETLFEAVRDSVWKTTREFLKDRNEETKNIDAFHFRSGSHKFAKAVVDFSKAALQKDASSFVTPSDTLPFRNGLYNLVTGKFRGFIPSDNIVSTLQCRFLEKAECPQWESMIRHVVGEDSVRYVQQVLGFLIGSKTTRAIFFLVGPKNAGKTTIISTLHSILRDYAGTAQLGLIHSTRSFSEDEDSARMNVALFRKRFVYMDETKQGAEIDTAKMKRIASPNTVLTARYLRHDAFQFLNEAKVVVLTNNEPRIDMEDSAAWERVKYIPFVNPVAEPVEGFKEVLLKEASGIMNWCIAGYQDWLANGFVVPEEVQRQVRLWQTEDNPIIQFVDDRCHLTGEATAKELLEAYDGWRGIAGFLHRRYSYASPPIFVKALQRLYPSIESKRSKTRRFISGISIKE